MKTKPQLLTDAQYEKIVMMALTAKPQTEEQIAKIIKHAEGVVIDNLFLEAVLNGKACMYFDGDELMFCGNKSIEQNN